MRPCGRFAEHLVQGHVAVQCFFSAAQDDGIAAFHAEGGRVGCHVRSRLIDEKHHAQRHADFANLEAVGTNLPLHDFAHRVGQQDDLFQCPRDLFDPANRQFESVNGRGIESIARRGGDVAGIRVENVAGPIAEQCGRTLQPGILLRPGNHRQTVRGAASPSAQGAGVFGKFGGGRRGG